ncbi:MAG: putative sugar O-methyltransferase [Solirubrobacteraceae bacterium]
MWLKRILIGVGTPVGVTRDNWRLLEAIGRPWWFYRSGGRVPPGRIERRSPTPVTEADVALCERLLAAFTAITSQGAEQGETHHGIWAWILKAHQQRLADMLEHGDARELALLLAAMFQKEFVWGIAHGGHLRESESWLGSKILSLKSLDLLVSLAEALGVVPVENPEQGLAGVAFDGGIVKLIAKVDEALGFRVDAPHVGAPFGLAVDGHLITLETPEQIYATVRLDQAIRVHLHQRPESRLKIVDIGGGYGAMCYWLLHMQPDIARYTIVDLPITNVLQGYFLAQALGPATVSFYGEPYARVTLLPTSALTEVETPFDVLVNKNGMPEMPHHAMVGYLEWARVSCDGFFYSYNQEAGADFQGQTQHLVPEAVERIGGFNRIRRDQSWLRRGYAEEIYTRKEQLPAPLTAA